MTPCEIEGCEKPTKNRGLCAGHYERFRLGKPVDATPLGPSIKGTPIEDRFWPRVNKTATCWLWTGPLFDGYGRIKRGTKALPVHRFAYELLVGPIPDGLQIDHKCRVRHCVRPAHLQAVPQALNAQNRSRIGWGRSGARGVSWQSTTQRWQVRVGDGRGGRISGGHFRDLDEAIAAAVELRNQIMTNNLDDRRVA